MTEVLVSLIIPAYNVQKFIKLTLDSVLKQTLLNFECIVVDDFSTDNTRSIIQKYLKLDSRIKLVSHRANGGLSAARNTGLRYAQGKYIAFLDADDLIMPESLELRAKAIESYPENTIIGTYAGSVPIDMDCQYPPKGKKVNLKLIDFLTAGGNCPFNANQPMFKTNLFKKFGGFDHSLKQAEDYDMWMRILRCGFRIVPTNYQLVTYRQTQGSMVRDNPLMHLDISHSRYESSFHSYPINNFNENFSTNLMKPLSEYLQELNITNRVLEFLGIAIASGANDIDIVNRLINYLPNYFSVIEQHKIFEKEVYKGIKRFYMDDLSLIKKQSLDIQVNKIYELFKKESIRNKDCNLEKDSIDIINEEVLSTKIVSQYALQKSIDVFFFPHKDYHVQKIHLLRPYLNDLGIKFLVVDISMHYRDEGVKTACQKFNIPTVGYSNFLLANFRPKAIIVFNDWDPIVRSIVLAAKKSRIPTIGIVEGIQDYHDADTKQDRKAYQVVETLLLPGNFDKKYFAHTKQDVHVTGLPRIYELYLSDNKRSNFQKLNSQRVALINSNFSYGVLEEHRDLWLEQAVNACKNANYKIVISRHPADKGTLYNEYVTENSFYKELEKSDVLISRFATGILEALAMNVIPIYFNPHSEKVDKFAEPMQAYPQAETTEQLYTILNSLTEHYLTHQPFFDKFLFNHCGDLNVDPSKKVVEIISEKIKNSKGNAEILRNSLEKIDSISGVFNNVVKLREYNLFDMKVFSEDFDEIIDNLKSNIIQKNYEEALYLIDMMYLFTNCENGISNEVLNSLETSIYKLIKVKNKALQ